MKQTLLLITAILFLGIQSYAQNVAINNDCSEPDPSAALDVKASDKGVLIPRVDFNNLPLSPATGLLVYITANGPDGNDAFYYYDGSSWLQIASEPTTYEIGDFAQGGYVFWVDDTGQHGLVCAGNDQSSAIQWYNGADSNTEALGNGIYAGKMNTSLIIANQGHDSNDYAAGVCASYTFVQNGRMYGDWYLPSKSELNNMYQQKAALALVGCGFASASYWSSTETGSHTACDQDFTNGTQASSAGKGMALHVRAIRAF